jgi:hypothetical protein
MKYTAYWNRIYVESTHMNRSLEYKKYIDEESVISYDWKKESGIHKILEQESGQFRILEKVLNLQNTGT